MTQKQLSISHPWDQLPDETDTAYHRFSIYLELGPDRSLDKTRQKLAKSSGYKRQLQTWSSNYNWVERAGAYDRHLIRQALEDKEQIIEQGQARLLTMMDKALDELEEVLGMDNVLIVGEGNTSVVNQKLRAIENVLDRIGLVKQNEQPELNKPVTVNAYINEIYQRIERFNNEKNPD